MPGKPDSGQQARISHRPRKTRGEEILLKSSAVMVDVVDNREPF